MRGWPTPYLEVQSQSTGRTAHAASTPAGDSLACPGAACEGGFRIDTKANEISTQQLGHDQGLVSLACFAGTLGLGLLVWLSTPLFGYAIFYLWWVWIIVAPLLNFMGLIMGIASCVNGSLAWAYWGVLGNGLLLFFVLWRMLD